MNHGFFQNNKVVHVPPDGTAATTYALAAGTTDVNSLGVDRAGYERVAFVCTFGDNVDTGTMSMKAQHSDDNVTFTDCADPDAGTVTQAFTAGASDTDNEVLGVEVYGTKLKRYVRVAFDRGVANTVIAALHAILTNAQYKPVTQSTAAGQFIQAPTVEHVVS